MLGVWGSKNSGVELLLLRKRRVEWKKISR